MKTRTGLGAAVCAALVLAAVAVPAAAAPPGRNNAITSPIIIGTFPYTNTQDTQRATTGATDPGFCFDPEGPADANTVWYSYVASADGRLAVNTFGSNYDTTLYVGTPDGAGGMDVLDCTDDSAGGFQSYVGFDAVAGTRYLFMVGTCCGSPGSDGGGSLVFGLDVGAPPLLLDVTVDPTGDVDRGVVTLTGTATCSQEVSFAFVDIGLSQKVGQRAISGFGGTELTSCGPVPSAWSVVLEGSNGRFAGGLANGEVSMFACAIECENVSEPFSVKLN